MHIICGLGNPGKDYALTRHNMGFITVELLAERFGVQMNKLKFRSLVAETSVGAEKLLLVKPQTYMNLSGEALREIMAFYKEDISNLLVIYDDIDLPVGGIRVRPFGSAGTHNGMRSVIYQLQNDRFPRIRIGIGDHGVIPLEKYVIGKPTEAELELLKGSVSRAADAAECWVREGINPAMTKYNVKQ